MPKLDPDDFVQPTALPPTPGITPQFSTVPNFAQPINSVTSSGFRPLSSPMSGCPTQPQQFAPDTKGFDDAIAASAGMPEEHWMKEYWRPAMGWLYMLTCFCDFVLFPILWSAMQAHIHGAVQLEWNPITLQGAGLYHLAMGAVLGIAAYGRTKEKTMPK